MSVDSIQNDNSGTPLPADLRPIAHALDVLAQHERDSAPSHLETRIAGASRGAILDLREPVIARVEFAPTRRLWRLAMAACLGLVGTLTAVHIAGHGSAAQTTLASRDADMDVWLVSASPTGESLDRVGDQIDLLYADTASLDAALGESSPVDDLFKGGAL